MAEEVFPQALDLSQIVRPGDTVIWTQGAGEPLTLTEALMSQRSTIGPFRVFLGASYTDTVGPTHADVVSFLGMGAVGTNRALCKAGLLEIIPCHLSDVPKLLASGTIQVDVVFLQLSRENRDGEFSLGVINGYLQSALARARVVIAEVNDQAPWTFSRQKVDPDLIDLIVRTSRPLPEIGSKPVTDQDRAIAGHVMPFIPDGAVLQIGIGSIPNAVAALMAGRRDLGIHAGIIGDAVVDLIEAGVVTNATKTIDAGKSVTGGLTGTKRLYQFADSNPGLLLEPVSYTHDINLMRRFEVFIAINSAIEVDLTGQVNAEIGGRAYIGTIGGHTDFVRGALASPDGRSIIALPSRLGADGVSRIVSQIGSGVVTTARSDADVVVTEFGAAQLRGRSIPERVRSMIAIAHPEHREQLEREARQLVVGY